MKKIIILTLLPFISYSQIDKILPIFSSPQLEKIVYNQTDGIDVFEEIRSKIAQVENDRKDIEIRLESNVEAALVKELGNNFEKQVPELVRLAGPFLSERFSQTLNDCILHAPSFTLRGGTREILRGVIARELGLR